MGGQRDVRLTLGLDHEHGAAIELGTGLVAPGLRGDEARLAIADRRDRVRLDAALDQLVADGVSPLFRQPLVVIVAADGVGMTLGADHDARLRQHPRAEASGCDEHR